MNLKQRIQSSRESINRKRKVSIYWTPYLQSRFCLCSLVRVWGLTCFDPIARWCSEPLTKSPEAAPASRTSGYLYDVPLIGNMKGIVFLSIFHVPHFSIKTLQIQLYCRNGQYSDTVPSLEGPTSFIIQTGLVLSTFRVSSTNWHFKAQRLLSVARGLTFRNSAFLPPPPKKVCLCFLCISHRTQQLYLYTSLTCLRNEDHKSLPEGRSCIYNILGYYKRNRHFQCCSETKLLMI